MKVRAYQKIDFLIIMVVIIVIIELLILVFLFNDKMYKYKSIDGVVVKEDLIEVMVSKKDKSIIYENGRVFLNNKSKSYEIVENRGVITRHNNMDYYDILVDIKIGSKYKSHDIISLVWRDRKEKMIKLFYDIWSK